MASKNDEKFKAFCDELRAYVKEHKLFPPKHTTLNNKCRYVCKKINEGTLDEWKRVMFEEIANSRDLSIYTGGRKRKSDNEENKIGFVSPERRYEAPTVVRPPQM